MPELVIDPVYPCKVCKVNRPMHYTPEMSHGEMPEGLDLLTCWVCKTTQVRDQQERLKLRASIRKAWAALVDDIAYPVETLKEMKSLQIDLRVTPAEKLAIQQNAQEANMTVSAYMIQCASQPVDNPVDNFTEGK